MNEQFKEVMEYNPNLQEYIDKINILIPKLELLQKALKEAKGKDSIDFKIDVGKLAKNFELQIDELLNKIIDESKS